MRINSVRSLADGRLCGSVEVLVRRPDVSGSHVAARRAPSTAIPRGAKRPRPKPARCGGNRKDGAMKPTRRPANPCSSSGPCAKRPGWSPEALNGALLGRSHRSRPGLARLVEVIERSRAILQIPADYRLGIVPASDTGAVEMALWSLLGARGVDLCRGELRRGLGHRCHKAAQIGGCAPLHAPYGSFARSRGGRSGSRHGIRMERHHRRGARPERRLDRL